MIVLTEYLSVPMGVKIPCKDELSCASGGGEAEQGNQPEIHD